MTAAKKLLSTQTGGDKLYVDDVFSTYPYTGNGSTQTINNGIDLAGEGGLVWIKNRTYGSSNNVLSSAASGTSVLPFLWSNTTNAAFTGESPNGVAFAPTGFAVTGPSSGQLGTDMVNVNSAYASWTFRRAPKFFDVVCDTGTGSAHAINHSLTVAPELVIRKSRSASTQWEVWHSALAATEKLVLNTTAGKVTDATAFGTLPTATQFYVGASSNTNASAATYVTYLFATLPGISKVGSYTGNGTSLSVECGFSTGARFILVKSVDDVGDWFVWDTARGIVAANDPHLSLNTSAAEVTTDDSVDPYSGGFIVNQNTATNININGKRYIFLAIA